MAETRQGITGLEQVAAIPPMAIEAFRDELGVDPSLIDDQMFALGAANPRFELAVLGIARHAREAGMDPEQAAIEMAAFLVGSLRRKASTDELALMLDLGERTDEKSGLGLLPSGA